MKDARAFGLYVHWPFCQAKCPYCDFNSHVVANVDQSAWASAFESEIDRVSKILPDRVLNTIYFGGGTPSLMTPRTVETIIAAARKAWPMANDIEITIEANPTSVEAENFRGYAEAGVNRASIGVQALNDTDLRALGRLHSVDEAIWAIEQAKSVFSRTSFDLIYARQNQTLVDWEKELSTAVELADGHLSLYQLTIEDGTAFGDRFKRGGLSGLPSEDLAADMYELTQVMTEAAGMPAYEISNHATSGNESRHNMIYWRNHDWIGVGPGAHGRYTKGDSRIASEAHSNPGRWMAAVQDGSGDLSAIVLPESEVIEEAVIMGLRMAEGIDVRVLDKLNDINCLLESGLLGRSEHKLWATKRGRPLLNAILRELLA